MLRKDENGVIFRTNQFIGTPAPNPRGQCSDSPPKSKNKVQGAFEAKYKAKRGNFPAQGVGMVKRKVEPRPGALSTHTSPPISWTRCFTMESPKPVPPFSRERAESTR